MSLKHDVRGGEAFRRDLRSSRRRMFSACASAAAGLCLAWFCTLGTAAEPSDWTVSLRDGSMLRVRLEASEVPWRNLTRDGAVVEGRLPLDKVERITFVATPATDRIAAVQRELAQITSDNFAARDAAQRRLAEIGVNHRRLIVEALNSASDLETRWRLQETLHMLPESAGDDLHHDYDVAEMSGGEIRRGDVGDWQAAADFRGAEVIIDRRSALAMWRAAPRLNRAPSAAVAVTERIGSDDDAHFPSPLQRIDFDRGPEGEMLRPGQDVARLYAPSGVLFSTSAEGGQVAIVNYDVGGKSRRQSAANNRPLYEGVITARFCHPGNEQYPAGVRAAGVWVSHVAPGGTKLIAYDSADRPIGEVATVNHEKDFLALRSNVPIAYVQIAPQPDIDKDYAIDDLTFDFPQPLPEVGNPHRYTLALTTGERITAAKVSSRGEELLLQEADAGLAEIAIPQSQIAMLLPARPPFAMPAAEPTTGWVRTTEGSVLRIRQGSAQPEFAALPGLVLPEAQYAALWGNGAAIHPPPAEFGAPGAARIHIGGASEPTLAAGKITAEGFAAEDASIGVLEFPRAPMIWLRPTRERAPAEGAVRLHSGEQLVLGAGGFALAEWNAQGATVERGNERWTFTLAQIQALILPE